MFNENAQDASPSGDGNYYAAGGAADAEEEITE